MTKRTVRVADLFCGAGGSSTGAKRAIEEVGGVMDLVAVNHWNTAIATHSKNHPGARHIVEDVNLVDPESVVKEGRLDILMASPECKYHSRARGGKPIHDQGRMNPWAVMNWLTKLDVRCVLVENVPEFVDWGPLDPETNRPDKSKKGLHFQAWFMTFQALGYDAEWRMLNAADYGDATTRTRFFLIARRDGMAIRWPEPTHARGDTGMFPGRLPWRGAREIINWDNLGRSLLDDPKYMKKPLSIKTRQRIAKGLDRFGGPLASLYIRLLDLGEEHQKAGPQGKREKRGERGEDQEPSTLDRHGAGGPNRQDADPFHGSDRQHTAPRDMDQPILTATGLTGGGNYLVKPGAEPFVAANRNQNAPKGLEEPIPPATTGSGGGSFMVEPQLQPFMLGQQSQGAPRSTEDPAPTILTDGAISLIRADGEPFVLSHQRGTNPRGQDDPIPGMTTKGPGYLVRPAMIVHYYGQSHAREPGQPLSTITTFNKHALANPILVEYYSNGGANRVEDPLHTITTKDRHALTSPTLVEVNHGNGPRGEQSNEHRTQSPSEPLRTITGKRGTGLANPALIEINHGNGPQGDRGNDRRVHPVDEPLGSITTIHGMGLVDPVLVQTGQTGGNGAYSRPVENPLPTLTTKNDTHVVTPGAEPFVVPSFGEREGQEPRVHDIEQPAPAVTSRGAGSLVSPTMAPSETGEMEQTEDRDEPLITQAEAESVLAQAFREGIDPRRIIFVNGVPHLLDIRFRMLENAELARAMGFDDEETKYEFVGTVSEVTKQIGNAVAVNTAAALVRAVLQDPAP